MRRPNSLAIIVAAFACSSAHGQSAAIQLDSIPQYGAFPGVISGKVSGVDLARHRVAPFIFVSGLGWFSKPVCANPSVDIAADGRFTALLTSGGLDSAATRVALLVVPSSLQLSCTTAANGLPADVVAASVGKLIVFRPNPSEREISLKGQAFGVKASSAPVGPGPCVFSDSSENVFADAAGLLHLRLTRRNNTWNCAEVVTRAAVEYGRYKWTLTSFPRLDRTVVFGAFLWADGELDPIEMDVEIGFSGSDSTNAQFVVQPFLQAGHLQRITIPVTGPITFVMSWSADTIRMQGFAGETDSGTPFAQWTYPFRPPSATSTYQNFRFNVWTNGAVPADDQPEEVVISDFSYERAVADPSAPQLLAAVNPASYTDASSPGGALSVFGRNLSKRTPAAALSLPLAYTLGDVSANINGIPAPLYYAGADQINVQVPALAPRGPSLVSVTASGQPGLKFPFRNLAAAPSIFMLGTACLAQNQDSSLNSAQNPAAPGSVLIVYLTGIGPTDNLVPDGYPAPTTSLARASLSSTATLGGQAASIDFLGLAPTLVGVAQANVKVPLNAAAGARDLNITVGGATSNSCSAFIAAR